MDSLSSWDIGMSCARVEPKGAEETEDGAAPPIPPHNLIHLPKGLSSLFPLFISAKREPPLCRDLPHCCPLKPNQPSPIWQRFMWRLWAGFFSLPTGRVIHNAQKWRLWMVGGKTHCRKPSQNLILLLRNFNSYVTWLHILHAFRCKQLGCYSPPTNPRMPFPGLVSARKFQPGKALSQHRIQIGRTAWAGGKAWWHWPRVYSMVAEAFRLCTEILANIRKKKTIPHFLGIYIFTSSSVHLYMEEVGSVEHEGLHI